MRTPTVYTENPHALPMHWTRVMGIYFESRTFADPVKAPSNQIELGRYTVMAAASALISSRSSPTRLCPAQGLLRDGRSVLGYVLTPHRRADAAGRRPVALLVARFPRRHYPLPTKLTASTTSPALLAPLIQGTCSPLLVTYQSGLWTTPDIAGALHLLMDVCCSRARLVNKGTSKAHRAETPRRNSTRAD